MNFKLPYIAVGFCLLAGIVFLILNPRPYYLLENDYENGHYYNFRLLSSGFPIHNVEHPGTPVMILGAALMRLVSSDISKTTCFLMTSRIFILLLHGLVFFWFFNQISKYACKLTNSVLLTVILTWPPLLTFWDYFCSESFVFLFGLPLTVAFVSFMSTHRSLGLKDVLKIAVILGMCLSIKWTFLPVFLVMLMTSIVRILTRKISLMSRLFHTGIILVLPAIVFEIMIFPVKHRTFEIIEKTFFRIETHASKGTFFIHLMKIIKELALQSPGFLLLMLILVISTGYALIRLISGHEIIVDTEEGKTIRFDRTSILTFILLSAGMVMYVISNGGSFRQRIFLAGHALRNLTPLIFIACSLLVFIGPVFIRCAHGWIPGKNPVAKTIFLCLLILLSSTLIHFKTRAQMISDGTLKLGKTQSEFAALHKEPGVFAFWDGSPGTAFGEMSFHFWGNYRYGHDFFDSDLHSMYPNYSFFKLRELARLIRRNVRDENIGTEARRDELLQVSSLKQVYVKSGLKKIWRTFQDRYPNPYEKRNGDLIAGERDGINVSMIAWPVKEYDLECAGLSLEIVRQTIQNRFGVMTLAIEKIAGQDWMVFRK